MAFWLAGDGLQGKVIHNLFETENCRKIVTQHRILNWFKHPSNKVQILPTCKSPFSGTPCVSFTCHLLHCQAQPGTKAGIDELTVLFLTVCVCLDMDVSG